MPSDLLHSLVSNVWMIFIVVLLFGGTIFVHELGHFLAARRRGVRVERFSVGFGPAIVSWRGRDGVEYRISWLPVGGYVLLPQLADVAAIEGPSAIDVSKLAPVDYPTKVLVFTAGAFFNVLFALALATIVWVVGQPVSTGISSTTIAEILPMVAKTDGTQVVSPAAKAELRPGDVVTAVDGKPVATFGEMQERIAFSSGWTRSGARQTVLTIRRNGKSIEVAVQPVISGPEQIRTIGFYTAAKLVIGQVTTGSAAGKAGFRPDDRIISIDGKPALSLGQLADALRAAVGKQLAFTVQRENRRENLVLRHIPISQSGNEIGIKLRSGFAITHPSPFRQVWDCITNTFSSLGAFLNPHSDIGASQFVGPIGIISTFVDVSRAGLAGLPFALWFTILLNVDLAVINLLPVPVLDGGHILFATIARLRGRALPTSFIMATQSVFVVLLIVMMGYMSFFVDIPRILRESRAAHSTQASAPASPAPPQNSLAPKTGDRQLRQ